MPLAKLNTCRCFFSILQTVTLILFCFSQEVLAQENLTKKEEIVDYKDIFHPVIARKGMVVSQSELASDVGADILSRGGNAVDAAVAVGFALAVTLPRAGNLGGGGFMLVHLAKDNKTIAIDYRETAPAAAFRELFLDENGEPDKLKSLETLTAAGIPGTVAGLHHALNKYGTMSWSQVIEPARKLAEIGITIDDDMQTLIEKSAHYLRLNTETCRVYFKKGCQAYQAGEPLKQGDLAKSLAYLQKEGPSGFYQGDIANKIVSAMKEGDGLITLDDLANYKIKEVAPIRGTFNGYEILTMPPPSSGGVHIIQMLNMLETLPLENVKQGSAQLLHYQAEIFKRAYADRSTYLGDPDYVKVPVKGLISKKYAAQLSKNIQADVITPSEQIKAGKPARYESPDTTHYSVIDAQGNAVSNTYTLNHYYGSGIIIPGTGFFMNNTMDDFSAKPGRPNSYGLIGGEANSIEANKRPLSSMSPTIVLKEGKPYLVTGSPGGSKIITSVFQQLVNVLLFDMNVAEATNAVRIHHQWQPDVLYFERDLSSDTLDLLQAKGYTLQQSSSLGSLQAIMLKDGVMLGAADPRRPGAKAIAAH